MAGRGPAPKPAATRQRRNKKATKATLPPPSEAVENEVPPLPEREGEWHPMVMAWWSSVWCSPMASRYLDADVGGLYLLADLYQKRWEARDDTGALVNLAKEIRLQEARYGLTPIDRSRLQWEVARAEEAEQKRPSRRTERAPEPPSGDPRAALKAI